MDLIHVRQQNKDLKAELDRVRLEEDSMAEDARQGQRLQGLLGFKEKYVYKTVAAQVIGTSGTEQSQVLLIDKGSKDGIKPDMPVITPDGIVGKTRDVFRHTSQVLEISDPTSGAGVILEKTRIRGVLRGDTWGQPEIVNVSPDERIQRGEAVLTSGGDAIYPRGLAVGTVDRVRPDPEGTLVNVLIKPAANLSQAGRGAGDHQHGRGNALGDAAGSDGGRAGGAEGVGRAGGAAAFAGGSECAARISSSKPRMTTRMKAWRVR